uniref:RxLR effector protein n=1 Tax=Skeletonema marinoi TaxID=267567 RepID=A0A7S2KU03_9STRA|mmetsp:Transcript_16196/g.27358  ORF Transcript_16196/g.27358 Transcript_16196/m.27358 type:complete len:129 (+) Transcript_16196:47-433(+)
MMALKIAALALWVGGVNGFVATHQQQPPMMSRHLQMAGSDLPYGPPLGSKTSPDLNGNLATEKDDDEDNNGGATLKGNRFSKYAPDASLDTADFRQQLKDNMKADLERRRREDPNRGNQPAKTYLDNL